MIFPAFLFMGDKIVVSKWISLWEVIVRDKILNLLFVVTGEKNSPTAVHAGC
jgi:hypothetical protein